LRGLSATAKVLVSIRSGQIGIFEKYVAEYFNSDIASSVGKVRFMDSRKAERAVKHDSHKVEQ